MLGTSIPNTLLVAGPKPVEARSGKFVAGVSLPFATAAEAFADVAPERRASPGVFVAIGPSNADFNYYKFVPAVPGTDNGWDLMPITIPATFVIEDVNHRFLTDAEIAAIQDAIDTSVQPGEAIMNQLIAPQVGSNFWIDGKAILGAGVDNGAQLQVKGQAVIDGNTHIDGKGIIGIGGADNGAIFQVKGGVASLDVNTADYPIINGGLSYRSDLAAIRAGINGVWKSLATTDSIPDAILNQSAVTQTATFKISGKGTVGALDVFNSSNSIIDLQTPTGIAYISGLATGSTFLGAFGWVEGYGGGFQVWVGNGSTTLAGKLMSINGSSNMIFGNLTTTNGGLITNNITIPNPAGVDIPVIRVETTSDRSIYTHALINGMRWKGAYGWDVGDDFVFWGGGGSNSKEAELLRILRGGGLKLHNMPSDPAVNNGAILYRTDTAKIRAAVGGVWKNLATEDQLTSIGLTGHTVYVDKDSASATDVRTGLSPYSAAVPFKTINAAAQVANYLAGDVVYVRVGTYTENINSAGHLKLLLEPDVVINGNVLAHGYLSIIGLGRLTADSSRTTGAAIINTNTDAASTDPYAGNALAGIHSNGQIPLVLVNIATKNAGTGIGVYGAYGNTIRSSRIVANGIGVHYTSWGVPTNILDSWIFSANTSAVSMSYPGTNNYIRSTFISLAAGNTPILSGSATGFVLEDCKLYSQNGFGFNGGRTYLSNFVVRNNLFNTFSRAFTYGGDADGAGQEENEIWEITGNTFNVRDTSEPYAFLLQQRKAAHTGAPIITGNLFNKASFVVQVPDGTFAPPLVNIEAGNVGSLNYPATYPYIYTAGDTLLTNILDLYLEITIVILTFLLTSGIALNPAQATDINDIIVASPTSSVYIPLIEAYLLTLGYTVDLSSFI